MAQSRSSKPSRAPARASKTPKAKGPFTTTDADAAYAHFLPIVDAAYPGEVPIPNGDASLVRHNVGVGLKAIAKQWDELAAKAPGVDWTAVQELPALTLGLVAAEARVPAKPTSDGSIDRLVHSVAVAREVTAKYLDVVASLGLVDAARVRAIHEGSGKIDLANDGLAIVAVFDEEAKALAGKHPFTKELLTTLKAESTELLDLLKPGGAPKKASVRSAEAKTRDRFFKAVSDRYESLRSAATLLFGVRGLDAKVPALLSRTHASAKKKGDAGTTAAAGGAAKGT